ncbi:MAG: FAD-dependent oxidoreductase, partial [Rhodococcus sp. (in: high G+C Gram-positive bacteria)]
MTTSERERNSADVIVIGGGIGGVSLGYELASDRRVALLERESTLAFHTTGRSAALFLETYGNSTIRALTTASRAFLVDPPEHFRSELLAPRPLLQFAATGRGDA